MEATKPRTLTFEFVLAQHHYTGGSQVSQLRRKVPWASDHDDTAKGSQQGGRAEGWTNTTNAYA